jgi:hypothetical protein
LNAYHYKAYIFWDDYLYVLTQNKIPYEVLEYYFDNQLSMGSGDISIVYGLFIHELISPETMLLGSKLHAHYKEIYLVNLRIIYILLTNTQNNHSIERIKYLHATHIICNFKFFLHLSFERELGLHLVPI